KICRHRVTLSSRQTILSSRRVTLSSRQTILNSRRVTLSSRQTILSSRRTILSNRMICWLFFVYGRVLDGYSVDLTKGRSVKPTPKRRQGNIKFPCLQSHQRISSHSIMVQPGE